MGNELVKVIMDASASGEHERLIQPFDFMTVHQNELVFFLKPGCFQAAQHGHVQDIIELGIRELQDYHVTIAGVLMLSGTRLEELEIMDRHYGYINRLSKQASNILHDEDFQHIYEELGITSDFQNYQVLGGHEFLQHFQDYTAGQLKELWASKHSHRLRSGFYIQKYEIDGQHVILVNGFHPSQLEFFTNPVHKIVLFLLHSDTNWHDLKYDMVGDTFPENAKPTSIRGELYAHHDKYGLREVTVSNNMVHLSAGPFEAMFEVYNFLHAIPALDFDLMNTNMGRFMRAQGHSEAEVTTCCKNPVTTIHGEEVDLFTCTEDKNSKEALEAYIQHFAA
jgi:hypothetical protein